MAILSGVLTDGDTPGSLLQAKTVTKEIATGLSIRDTTAHNPTTDANVFLGTTVFLGGPKLLYVRNGLNQSVTVELWASIDGVADPVKVGSGSASVAAGVTAWMDSGQIAGLAGPVPYPTVNLTAGVSPTTGTLDAYIVAKSA